ncbi:MAG: hypothetical protein Q9160_008072 [Pyrenula sp. 1 TL-2023]
MSFLGKIINEFSHPGHSSSGQGYVSPQGYSTGAPQVPPPWIARWEEQDQRWLFINEQTGERTSEFPQQRTEYYQGGVNPQSGYYQSGTTLGGNQYYEEKHESRGHGAAYGAAGAAAGLAGGALLMHEGQKIEQDWDEDKYRMENKLSGDLQEVGDFPENAARWTGEKVQDVEDIPQNVEQDYDRAKYGIEGSFDNAVQDVEDAPEDAAGWIGDKVGDVEQFGDNMENAYNAGREEARYDDEY